MEKINSGKFTDKQLALVDALAEGLTNLQALDKAGYSAKVKFSQVISSALIDEIKNRTGLKIQASAPRALELVLEIIENDTAPDKLRLEASKIVLDRAGYIAPKAPEHTASNEKALHEMSRDELAVRAERLQKEISERARTIVSDTVKDTDT